MQPINSYEIGQTVRLEGKTVLDNGVPALPDEPRIFLQDPDGNVTSLSVELGSVVGTWGHSLYITGPTGLYAYRLVTSTDAEEHLFYVRPSQFAEPLAPAPT